MTAWARSAPWATGLQAGCRSGGASLRESFAASTPRGAQARCLRSRHASAGLGDVIVEPTK
jgi:hypothetical protein